jgi:hypothetical protein
MVPKTMPPKRTVLAASVPITAKETATTASTAVWPQSGKRRPSYASIALACSVIDSARRAEETTRTAACGSRRATRIAMARPRMSSDPIQPAMPKRSRRPAPMARTRATVKSAAATSTSRVFRSIMTLRA